MNAPLTLIVAVADNGVIGLRGQLPWKIPEDLKFFKTTTMGHAIIMGRKTWAEVGKPLPGRRNIIVTRDAKLVLEGAEVVTSLDDAIAKAHETDDSPFLIGGAELFAMAIPRVTKMLITEVHRSPEGDTFFPKFDRSAWRETSRRKAETAEGVEFVTLER